MKKKFGLWFNIVTICLCVCAIAIGVYSATTANLNASGKLGFTAHGCDVDVSGTIVGHATGNTADGLPVTTPESLGEVVEVRSDTQTLDLGSRYFTDMASTDGSAEDIVVTLTVTNKSKFKVTATFGTITTPDGVTATPSPASADLETAGEEGDEATFTITLSLTTTSSSITMPDTNNLSVAMEFNKFVEEESPYFINVNNQLAVDMGHATPTDIAAGYEDVAIEWIAFAVKGEDLSEDKDAYSITVGNDTWYSLSGVNMNNATYTGKTFWFIQRYVTGGGYAGIEGTYITGQVFDADGVNNDYDQSDICAYLSETGGYISTAVTGIANSDLYGKISERSVSETYTVDYNDVPQECSFSSRLWLLSEREVGLLNGAEASCGNIYSEPVKAYGIGNIVDDADGALWWLRSPDPADACGNAHCVINLGGLGSDYVNDYIGVRAAFEITIS